MIEGITPTSGTEPMPETRIFPLGDILTIITGCMLARDGMSAVYAILNWMTGENLFTHQLPRVARECAPRLLKQHPDLAAVTVPDFGGDEQAAWSWLDEQIRQFGATRPVARLHPDDHTRIDPLTELRMIAPDTPAIVVEVPPTNKETSDCTCYAPEDAEPEDHGEDCPEYPG